MPPDRPRYLFPAIALGVLAAALIAPPVAAADAPQVSLGRFQAIYDALEPWLELFFVGIGLYVIIVKLARFLHGLLQYEQAKPRIGLGEVLRTMIVVTLIVGLAVLTLRVGLDVFNDLLKFIWNAAGSGS